jgi:hypothetical protein
MNNIRNENCAIILKEKAMEKNTTHKNLINDLLNENFIRDNQIILNNHFGETKKNFTKSIEKDSTRYSSKGFFMGTNNLPNMSKTLKQIQYKTKMN